MGLRTAKEYRETAQALWSQQCAANDATSPSSAFLSDALASRSSSQESALGEGRPLARLGGAKPELSDEDMIARLQSSKT